MTIIDICIILTVVVFLSATTYEYLTSRRDDLYYKLYDKEKQYNEYLLTSIKEKDELIKKLKNEISKNS
jgi:hypothetical protein